MHSSLALLNVQDAMPGQYADAELLQDALMLLTRSGLLAGKVAMPDLHALSRSSRAIRKALLDAPTLFWQVSILSNLSLAASHRAGSKPSRTSSD